MKPFLGCAIAFFWIANVSELSAGRLSDDLLDELRHLCEFEELTPSQKGDLPEDNYKRQVHNVHLLFEKENFDAAYLSINESLRSIEQPKVRIILQCLKARIYYVKGLHQQSIDEYQAVLDQYGVDGIMKEKSRRILKVLGTILLHQARYKESIGVFKKLGNLLNQNYYDSLTKNSIHNIGLCYLHLKKFDSAEIYLRRSLKLEKESLDTLGQAKSYTDLANLFYEQYKDDLAIPLFEKGLEYAVLSGNDEVLKSANLNMAVVNENRKSFRQALDYRKNYEKIQQKLWDRDRVWELAKKEKTYELNLKEKEISILNERERAQKAELISQKTERNAFFLASLFLLVVVVGTVWAYRKIALTNKIVSKQKDELQELNNTKNQLFSIVAHDLKSPVFGLRLAQDRLEGAVKRGDREEVDRVVNENKNITDRTYSLLNNVLQWALEQTNQISFDPEIIDGAMLLEGVAYDYEAVSQGKQIDLSKEFGRGIQLNVDINSMKIVLRNLLDNAIKFTPESGKIYLKTKVERKECIITVRDTGMGMSEDQINSLCEVSGKKMNQDTDGRTGTGLGMVLCYALVQRNQGRIEIDSDIGKGTSVKISLPLYKT